MASTRGNARQTQAPVSVSFGRIQEEAIRLFAEQGYAATSMRDIASAVGLLPGSLYAHISGKEDLLLKIVQDGIQNYLDVMDPIAASDDPADVRMRGLVYAYMDVVGRTLEQSRVAFDQWSYLGPENLKKIVKLRQRYESLFTTVLDDGVAAGIFADVAHRKISALAVIGLLNSVTGWYSVSGPLTVTDIADGLSEFVLSGLAGNPAPRSRRKRA
jgi:AcrR family transcriptional regulator